MVRSTHSRHSQNRKLRFFCIVSIANSVECDCVIVGGTECASSVTASFILRLLLVGILSKGHLTCLLSYFIKPLILVLSPDPPTRKTNVFLATSNILLPFYPSLLYKHLLTTVQEFNSYTQNTIYVLCGEECR